jgi:gluconate transporter
MDNPWPALFTLASLVLLLVLIIRYQLQAFVALLVASLALGLASGMAPHDVVRTMTKGIGDLLRDVTVILALGAMLGRILEASGGAEVIAGTLIRWFGPRQTPLALLLASFLVGIPVLFNVGFLLLIPIVYRLQQQTGRSLLWFMLPMTFGLSFPHSLVPPHPGVIGAVTNIAGEAARGRVMVETIIAGSALSLVLASLSWFLPGRYWAKHEFIETPQELAGGFGERAPGVQPSFAASLLVVTLPLFLCLLGFGVQLARDLKLVPEMLEQPWTMAEVPPALAIVHTKPIDWLRFLGDPTIALLVATGVGFWLLGGRLGFGRKQLAGIAEKALHDVGAMVFLFGAAGGFKEVIQATGAGPVIAEYVGRLPVSPVAVSYCVAGLVRVALGSATAAILTASALVASVAHSMPGMETLFVLAVSVGCTVGTQPADSGFWMVKEYGNLTVRDVFLKFNGCRLSISLVGLGILLIVERWMVGR